MEAEEAMAVNDTVPKLLWHGVRTRGDRVILRQKVLGIWRATTWTELGRIAREIGMGLAALGLQPGEVASILRTPRPIGSAPTSASWAPRAW
jgi:long-chain acyl-CoA synthetase